MNRGGDHHADKRRRRDEALVALGQLLAPGASARQQAERVVSRLERYCPVAGEQSRERLLMAEIVATGLKLPSLEQARKIIGSPKKPGCSTHEPPQLWGEETLRLPMGLEFCGELDLKVGDRVLSLSPAEAFGMAQDLIRRASRQLVIEGGEEGRNALLDVARPGANSGN